MSDPHRVTLDRGRVDRLARAIPDNCGIAVAYKPGVGYVLIGGEHRFAALAQRNVYETGVYVVASWRDFLAWMIADLERPGGLGWTVVDAAHLHNKVMPLLNPARTERGGRDLAEFTGIHEAAIASVRMAMETGADQQQPQEVRERIADFIAGLARGLDGGSGARDTVRRIQREYEQKTAPALPADKQRQMLNQAISTLEGLLSGLEHLGNLNDDLTVQEREAFAVQIGKANAKLSGIKNTLRRS